MKLSLKIYLASVLSILKEEPWDGLCLLFRWTKDYANTEGEPYLIITIINNNHKQFDPKYK